MTFGISMENFEIQIATRLPPGPEEGSIGSIDFKKFGQICRQKRVRYITTYYELWGIVYNIDKKVSDILRWHQNADGYTVEVAQAGHL